MRRCGQTTALAAACLCTSGCLVFADPPLITQDMSPPATGWTEVAVLDYSLCALDGLGQMWCGSSVADLQLEAEGPFISISSGSMGTCAVADDGDLDCGFGSDPSFDLTGTYSAVSGDPDAGCGLELDTGLARCWPEDEPDPGSYASLGAGDRFACGILQSTAYLDCWGINNLTFTEALWDLPSGPFSKVVTKNHVGCALGFDDSISCWGYDFAGILPGPPDDDYQDLALTYNGGCALTLAGAVVCWGDDASNPAEGQFYPPFGVTFSQISLGWGLSCGVTTGSTLVCWE